MRITHSLLSQSLRFGLVVRIESPTHTQHCEKGAVFLVQAFHRTRRVQVLTILPPPASSMAYVDHAFSISDEDIMMETSYVVHNRPPIKEIALAIALLVFGTLGIILGFFMVYNRVGGDRAHGNFLNSLT